MTTFLIGFGIGVVLTFITAFLVIRNNRKQFAAAMDVAETKIKMLRG